MYGGSESILRSALRAATSTRNLSCVKFLIIGSKMIVLSLSSAYFLFCMAGSEGILRHVVWMSPSSPGNLSCVKMFVMGSKMIVLSLSYAWMVKLAVLKNIIQN